MTIHKGFICCGLLFFFVFVYGNTMLMTMTKTWNMTALKTFNCHSFYLLSVAAKLVTGWSTATMFYGKKSVISALWYFSSKVACSHQICFCPFLPWKCIYVVNEQCNNTSCKDILCTIMHHCTLLSSRTGCTCKLNPTAVQERR